MTSGQSRRWAPAGYWAVAVLAVIMLVVACVVLFPIYVVNFDVPGAEAGRLSAKDLAAARNDVRTTLLQGLAGTFFIATAFFTWRQIRVSERQLRASEDEQVASRFTKAIEQLGDDRLDVRVGGIYALERIAHVSHRDHGPTVEVLTAFIRGRVPWPSQRTPTEVPPADAQAALTVLGRRNLSNEAGRRSTINLCRVDLRGADLRGGEFAGALFNDSNLDGADLRRADLSAARLAAASLRKANLRYAQLQDAILVRARLSGARLFGVNAQRAELIDADLVGARLSEADLRNVNFRRANLDDAYLGKAKLEGAALEQTSHIGTTWPEGWSPPADTDDDSSA
jgi:uncharacterized protein YjbI with pentapeptide repeats